MFHHLHRFRRLLATTLLAVFINVLLGQCWCAGMRPAAAHGQRTARPAAMLPNHACCRAAAERKAGKTTAQTRKSAQPEKSSGGGDDCCRKKSASLLAGLDAAGKQLPGPAAALLPVAQEFHFRASFSSLWDRTAAVRLVPPQHLPPKIPDIRIFIQSLTV